ncbi:ABC transporter permease [Paenibacillaceae bacterium WGS1546]|uniref:ABC transporter permease n=1 Tax=Cohnella sp. WGS1546 TaxID=3366810 RepID=UPI00372D205C
MKSYGAMAGRYLKRQRKRTLLTIVGIILSAALISALGTMAQSLKDNVILNTEYTDGSFHFGYDGSTLELYDTLKNHALVDRLGVYRPGEPTFLDDTIAVQTNAVDEGGFGLLPIHVGEGRLPASPDEIAIERWIFERLPGAPGLGGSAAFNGPDGQARDYRIVGILKNEKGSQLNGSSRAFTLADPKTTPFDSDTMLVLRLKPGVDISKQIDSFKRLGPGLFTNSTLLAMLGESEDNGLNTALSIIFGTLIGLVVLSTVAVIYNAFHIGVLERIRQFGLLRTLGATPAQIRNLVLREATVLSVIGVPIGLAVGWFGLSFALWLMAQAGLRIMMMESFRLIFHGWIFVGSFVLGFAAVYLAAWLPARKASSVSPVDAARGAGGIVRESYRRMRIPSPLRLIGIEGRMAASNIRRNRTKFRITTFSIVISMTLFIVFHYFTQQMLTMTTTTNEDDRIAFQLTRNALTDQNGHKLPSSELIPDEMVAEIAELPGVYGVYGIYSRIGLLARVPEAVFNREILDKTDFHFETTSLDGKEAYRVDARLLLYDEARLREASKYVQSGTADAAALAEGDNVLLIQTIKPYMSNGKRAVMPLAGYKVGDKLTLETSSNGSSGTREVTIAGILSQSPFDSAYSANLLTVIAAKPTFAGLLDAVSGEYPPEEFDAERRGLEIALEDDADPAPIRAKLEGIVREQPGSQLIDFAENQRETRNFNVQMRIFVYGFLIVIGVIGSLNIVNTVQTNLLLRRREIGLLQAVGMTMSQIRRMATAEGVWFGVIGSIWGMLIGAGICYFLYDQLSNVQGFPFQFPWTASLIACAAALIVGLLSVRGPLRRMEKANLLEELREEA